MFTEIEGLAMNGWWRMEWRFVFGMQSKGHYSMLMYRGEKHCVVNRICFNASIASVFPPHRQRV